MQLFWAREPNDLASLLTPDFLYESTDPKSPLRKQGLAIFPYCAEFSHDIMKENTRMISLFSRTIGIDCTTIAVCVTVIVDNAAYEFPLQYRFTTENGEAFNGLAIVGNFMDFLMLCSGLDLISIYEVLAKSIHDKGIPLHKIRTEHEASTFCDILFKLSQKDNKLEDSENHKELCYPWKNCKNCGDMSFEDVCHLCEIKINTT